MSELTEVVDTSGYVAAAIVEDVPDGWVLKVRVNGREIALARQGESFYTVDNSCSHAGGPLGDTRMKSECMLECPWHNSVFDARTGEVVRGPARKNLKSYPVLVEDGKVMIKFE